jgi:hypothetical protein
MAKLTEAAESAGALGFLTVVEQPDLGLAGGYLLLNLTGRPLEFHCTAPLKPTRAQEILYGATLRPYLFGELIGAALLARSQHKPWFVCTDHPAALAARDYADVPLVAVKAHDPEPAGEGAPRAVRLDGAHGLGAPLLLGKFSLMLPATAPGDRGTLETFLAALDQDFDLLEPFQRVREALAEAQRTSR